jgi:hypothetical protein
MAGHMGINGVCLKLGKGNTNGSMVHAGGIWRQKEHAFLLQVLLKLTLTYGKEEPGDSHPTINAWGRACAVPQLGEGGS